MDKKVDLLNVGEWTFEIVEIDFFFIDLTWRQQPHFDRLRLAFHGDLATILKLKLGINVLSLHQIPSKHWRQLKKYTNKNKKKFILISVFGHIYSALYAGCFTPRRQVDRVTKQAVSGHAFANNSCHNLTAVDSDCDL